MGRDERVGSQEVHRAVCPLYLRPLLRGMRTHLRQLQVVVRHQKVVPTALMTRLLLTNWDFTEHKERTCGSNWILGLFSWSNLDLLT